MLLRGQYLLGYTPYPDDVVERFVAKTVENGCDILRIFDALNDIRNLEVPIKAAKAAGAHVQAAVVYTVSPVHTMEHYLETGKRLAEMGTDSICIKDMAGLLAPYKAEELVSLLKKEIGLPVQVHCHYVGGLAVGVYLKSAEAGADVIDTASVPLAFGSSQPPVETVVRAFKETRFDTGLDLHLLFEIAHYFEELRKKNGYERGVTRIGNMRVFDHQVPGGMISNFVSQLEQQKALHRMQEVIEEVPRVREDLGYPPLVTPTSQIVGTQAVLNVLTGERYKMIPVEVRNYIQGMYGRPAVPIKPELVAKALGDRQPVTCRPGDLLEPKMDKLKEEIQDLAKSEEDVLTYALFPPIARKFFEYRAEGGETVSAPAAAPAPKTALKPAATGQSTASLQKEDAKVNISEVKELIQMLNATDISELSLESEGVRVCIRKGALGPAQAAPVTAPAAAVQTVSAPAPAAPVAETKEPAALGENIVEVTAPMVGTFYAAPSPDSAPFVKTGDVVGPGQTVCIVEAMKLMNEIEADVNGRIVDILVENGQAVEYGQVLFLIEKQ